MLAYDTQCTLNKNNPCDCALHGTVTCCIANDCAAWHQLSVNIMYVREMYKDSHIFSVVMMSTLQDSTLQRLVAVQDVYKTAEAVQALSSELGGKVVREAGPLPGLKTKITSVVDPDGWKTVFVDNKDFLSEL